MGQNVLQVTTADAEGNTTTTTFNALNKPEKVEKKNCCHELLSSKEIFYDAVGNKVGEVFHVMGGNRTYANVWSYGPEHRLESLTEASGTSQAKTTTYTYHSDGTLENIIKPDGVTLTHHYTPRGKIARFFSSDKTIDYAYTYDILNRVIQVEDRIQNTLTVRLYDDNDNLIYEQLANGLAVENRYDLLKRRTQFILPDKSGISYLYNAAFLTAIERKTGAGETLYRHSYTQYSLIGRPTETDGIGNTGKILYNYDEKNRLISIQHPLRSEKLSYDSAGQIISQTVTDIAGTVTSTYEYGNQQQLTRETGIANSSYEYDSIFNRIKEDKTFHHIDELNQLTDTGETLFSYDANGNRLTAEQNNGVTAFQYDALNRVSQILKTGAFKHTFTYDPFHRRLSQTTYKWNAANNRWDSGNTLRYIYDGENEIGSVDPYGNIMQLRVLGVGLGAEIGSTVAIEIDGAAYAPIHDHRGSVCCLIDASSGKPVQSYRYSAFGKEQLFSATAMVVNNPWRFSSKRTDDETGLVFFGKRYYDPSIGRWLTKDPLGTPDGINRYVFVQNQPINKIDLYGLFSFRPRSWSVGRHTHRLRIC